MFHYKDKSVYQKQTLNELLNEDNIVKINDIKIDVIDSHFSPSFFSIHKVKLIIVLAIAAVAIEIFFIVYAILNEKDNDYFTKSNIFIRKTK